ncbi:uncharacterized protein BKA78DRAFT_138485 [Phyllosticta capitalensis]|uniref:uncharacterized protein n=1 Tax=Phyllosticta capitalensis TaxID=121624 RepID=UPI00312D86F8
MIAQDIYALRHRANMTHCNLLLLTITVRHSIEVRVLAIAYSTATVPPQTATKRSIISLLPPNMPIVTTQKICRGVGSRSFQNLPTSLCRFLCLVVPLGRYIPNNGQRAKSARTHATLRPSRLVSILHRPFRTPAR